MTLLDLQWFLAARGASFALRLPVVLFVAFGIALGGAALMRPSVARRWTWYAPVLVFIAIALASSTFTTNLSLARTAVQAMILYWVMIVGSAVLVDSARRAELLVLAYGLQFLWWGLWGFRSGLVPWDPVLANFDGYGAWMVIGGGLCGFLLLATDDKWLKRALAVSIGLCAIGMVASFARGAFLAANAVFLVVWLRSPYKGKTLVAAAACAVVIAISASIFFGDEYWAEMSTILQGTEEETGSDRWEMWKAAWQVFLAKPLLGAGPENWGVFAASYFQPGEIGGVYGSNPLMLYGRQAHSSYVTILAELGVLGVLAFAWILVDFWRRNRYLRSEEAGHRWLAMGGRLRLRLVALGIEAAMIAWMGAAAVYSLAGAHWFYTILALNVVLHMVVTRTGSQARGVPRPRLRRRQLAGSARSST